MSLNIAYEALIALLSTFTEERKLAIQKITELIVKLELSTETMDIILTNIILEISEKQISEDSGIRLSKSFDDFNLIFDKSKNKKQNN